MLPLHKARVSVFNYDELPPGYYHRAMISGGAIQRFWHRQKFLEVAKRVPDGARVLDLGCGPGSFLSVLAETHPSVSAVGIDIASRQIEYARAEISAKIPGNRISFQAMDPSVDRLPFPDQSFDLITSVEVIEHIHPFYALKMLAEAKRLLSPGGKFVITTPNYRSLWPLIEILLERLSPVKYHDQHINRYTPNALLKFLESAGLDVERIDSIFILAPFLNGVSPQLANKLHAIERKLKPRLGSLLIAEARLSEIC